jgi:hypothetical protein
VSADLYARKSWLTTLAEISAIVALPGLVVAICQLNDGRKAQLQTEVTNDIQYSTGLLMPCWAEWKGLYYDAYSIKAVDNEFLVKVDIAQDKINITLRMLDPASEKVNVAQKIKDLMDTGRFDKIQAVVNSVLAKHHSA